jgi:hypothetical protein
MAADRQASTAATALPRPYFEDDAVKLYLGDASSRDESAAATTPSGEGDS